MQNGIITSLPLHYQQRIHEEKNNKRDCLKEIVVKFKIVLFIVPKYKQTYCCPEYPILAARIGSKQIIILAIFVHPRYESLDLQVCKWKVPYFLSATQIVNASGCKANLKIFVTNLAHLHKVMVLDGYPKAHHAYLSSS